MGLIYHIYIYRPIHNNPIPLYTCMPMHSPTLSSQISLYPPRKGKSVIGYKVDQALEISPMPMDGTLVDVGCLFLSGDVTRSTMRFG